MTVKRMDNVGIVVEDIDAGIDFFSELGLDALLHFSPVFPLFCRNSKLRMTGLAAMLMLSGCDFFTDAATRLAYDLEDAAGVLKNHGDTFTLYHETPSDPDECDGPYTVQLDKAGALVVWCRDDNGDVVLSPGTSYHSRFVHTPQTYYLDKAAGETLVIDLEQIGDKAVIVAVR
ncbi:hypothetical protein ACXYTJ_08140 [Gilvimarinus sp. F26214L]|uniref:hypothetical protein n=1 Tax=Gilvimarinus sp. DZF01 TaxID=3461371 RepID=UPI004045F8CB